MTAPEQAAAAAAGLAIAAGVITVIVASRRVRQAQRDDARHRPGLPHVPDSVWGYHNEPDEDGDEPREVQPGRAPAVREWCRPCSRIKAGVRHPGGDFECLEGHVTARPGPDRP